MPANLAQPNGYENLQRFGFFFQFPVRIPKFEKIVLHKQLDFTQPKKNKQPKNKLSNISLFMDRRTSQVLQNNTVSTFGSNLLSSTLTRFKTRTQQRCLRHNNCSCFQQGDGNTLLINKLPYTHAASLRNNLALDKEVLATYGTTCKNEHRQEGKLNKFHRQLTTFQFHNQKHW